MLNARSYYLSFFKPLTDRAFALVMLLVCMPLMLFISVALLFANYGKVFFVQKRIGKDEKFFTLLKFCTLRSQPPGGFLPDADRQFPLGNFLRHYHLDELPQLINVLKGDLSLIGPRPLLVEYLPYYTESQRTRHRVMPGISGLAQVKGGNALLWHQRLRLDSFYARHACFLLDFKILAYSVKYFLRKKHKPNQQTLFSESFITASQNLKPLKKSA